MSAPTEKPSVLTPDLDGIPEHLKRLIQWVNWRLIWKDDKWAKFPIIPGSYKPADTSDRRTWRPYEVAVRSYQNTKDLDGIGFVFALQDYVCGIDLDGCIGPDGKIEPWAAKTVADFDTYAELSCTGTGIHLICRGNLPGPRRRSGSIEMYTDGRYFTMTGRQIEHSTGEINDRQDAIDALYTEVFGPVEEQPAWARPDIPSTLSDGDVAMMPSRARNAATYRELFTGNWESRYGSQSEADAALCCIYAFYTRDPDQIDRVFRRSGLYRDKWERADYRERTLNGALKLVTEQYTPKGNGRDEGGRPLTPAEIEALADDVGAVIVAPGDPPEAPPPWDDGLYTELAELDAPQMDPPSEPRKAQPAAPTSEGCPALPESAHLDPGLGDGFAAWVDHYTDHAAARSPMTPLAFHQSAALFLPGAAIARRLRLPMPFGDVYPNLYIMWIAPTTLFRKSTALGGALDLMRRCFPHLLAAQDTTPEAFLSDLAGKAPPFLETLPESARQHWEAERDFAAQRASVVDELSGLLAGFGRDYNQGLAEAYLRLYDCEPFYQRSTRGQGRIIVRDAYYSLLGASTPMAVAQFLREDRLWHNGFWPRFAILTPEEDRPRWLEPTAQDEPPELAADLRRLYERLPMPAWPEPPEALDVTAPETVFAAWGRYNRALSFDLLTPDLDGRLYGSYGRLPMMALKVAMILAALDWPDRQPAPKIELPHLARALAITEGWRESLHRVLEVVDRTEFDRLMERVTKQLAQAGAEGLTLRDLYKSMKDIDPDQVGMTLEKMARLGMVEARDWQNPRGGPKTTKYSMARD